MKLEWEGVNVDTSRLKVFGGWVLRVVDDVAHNIPEPGRQIGWNWRSHICFIPDPKHEWRLPGELKDEDLPYE